MNSIADLLESLLNDLMENHAPEQTLITVDYNDKIEYCYLNGTGMVMGNPCWAYQSDNGVTVMIPMRLESGNN